jgi:DNA-binding IclR family transcriptional regulator
MLLTYLPADERRQLVDGLDLHEHTSQTFTDRKAFSEELAEIRAAHFAINDEEFIEGVVGLAVPVRDVSEAVVAALGAAAHTSECSADELIVRALPCLRQAGQEISIDLGYRVHRNE